MAYPRRQHPPTTAGSTNDLPPPRPFFLGPARSSSASSLDISSLDPASDSDSPPSAPLPRINTAHSTATTMGPHHGHGHGRRRSSEREGGIAAPAGRRDSGTWSPSTLYAEPHSPPPQTHQPLPPAQTTRPPPSSFSYPFLAYPGNPDPLPSRRRPSLDSTVASTTVDDHADNNAGVGAGDLRKPFAPFMAAASAAGNASDTASGASTANGSATSTTSLLHHQQHIPRSTSNNNLYKSSAAASIHNPLFSPPLPHAELAPSSPPPTHTAFFALARNGSTPSFRAPFLAPSSRPTSSLWSPPSYFNAYTHPNAASPSASTTALALAPSTAPALAFALGGQSQAQGASPYALSLPKPRPPLPSTRLPAPLTKADKPWLATRDPRSRASYIITLGLISLGLAGAAFLCFSGFQEAQSQVLDPASLCLVLDEEFTGGTLDPNTWAPDVELGGFGNGEFEMTTDDPANLYLKNGELYLMPTLTPDSIVNAGNYTLPGCTSANKTACSVASNRNGAVINPVMSARVNTKGRKAVRFGKVEVRAKMPTGDWLVPALTLLPVNNTYGAAFPLSGAITLAQARGNAPSYPAQGRNFVAASLVYGPLVTVVERIVGWYSLKRSTFAAGFHTYTLEWTDSFIRMSVDARTHTMLLTLTPPHGSGSHRGSYWERAGFPDTAQNGSAVVVVPDIYSEADVGNGGTRAAPFDQEFYLGISLGVGGTSGWFPDNVGGKMWFDGSLTAMRDFAQKRDVWYPTWPAGDADRAFRIDYVKMWEVCK